MLRQKDRVSESAFPQLRPGPRTRLPSLTSIWFSSLRVAQRCCSSPRALSSSGLGLSPKPMSNVPWCGKGQATGPQKATLPSHSSPAAAQGDRETRRFSHIPALRVQRRRSRRGRSPVLPAHTVTPDAGTLSGCPPFFPFLLISSWKMPAPGSLAPESPSPKPPPSIFYRRLLTPIPNLVLPGSAQHQAPSRDSASSVLRFHHIPPSMHPGILQPPRTESQGGGDTDRQTVRETNRRKG